MKKLLLILCAMLLTLSLVLTSCSGDGENGGNDTDGSTNDGGNDTDGGSGEDGSDGEDGGNTDGSTDDNGGNDTDGGDGDGNTDEDDEVVIPAGHECTYSDEWKTNDEKHWHETVCTEHDVIKKDEGEHTDADLNGECDACSLFMYHVVKVSIPDITPYNITLSDKLLKVEDGETASFTAEVSNKFVLSVSGATSSMVQKETTDVYTFTVKNVKSSMELTVDAEQIIFVTDVAWGEAEFAQLDSYFNQTSFEVEIKEAGTYVVFCDYEGVCFFKPFVEIVENESEFGGITEFEISKEQVGTVTLTAEYFDINFHRDEEGKPIVKDGFDFFWQIISRDTEMTLKSYSGEGYTLPTNTDFTLHTTIAEPGFYWISSNSGVTWNDSLGYGMFIRTHEPNEAVDIVVRCKDPDNSSFEFDWNISEFEKMTLNEGDNKLPLVQGEYTELHYTVEEEGAYRFDVSDINTSLYYWVVSAETSHEYLVNSSNVYYTEQLEVGDEVILFVCNNGYDVEEENVKVTYVGHGVDANRKIAYATEDGYVNSFINSTPDAENYAVSIADGYSLGIIGEDGEIEWKQSFEITVEPYSVYKFIVKGAEGEIALEIGRIYYEFQLEEGNNAVEVIPGKEYAVYLSEDIGFGAEYSIEWNDSNLHVFVNYVEIDSGDTLVRDIRDVFSMSYDGETSTTVTIRLSDFTVEEGGDDSISVPTTNDPLAIGENTVNIYDGSSGVTVSFTATESGSYTVNKTTTDENVLFCIEEASSSILLSFPYTFELEAGETIEFKAFTLVPGEVGIASVTITKN